MKNKIVLTIIALIVFIPILLREIKEYNLRKLKEETLKISEILKNSYSELTQINIEKKVKNIKTRGIGKAFIDKDNVTVILSYKGYCSVKLPTLNEVALSKSKCQDLELINNAIIPIVEKDGLVKKDNIYYYKGNANNYILFNNEYFRILSFESNKIKIVKDKPIKNISKNNYLEILNKNIYNQNNLLEQSYDISEININNKIEKINDKKTNNYIGILSLEDYLNTLNKKCTIKNNNLICSKSFITHNMWLSNYNKDNSYYVYNDGNIYLENSNELKDIYIVLTLKETKIISGDGSKSNPYIIL